MLISILWNLVAFVISLSIIVTVHEFGHFYVARCCGVRVERFSIGFGKPIWSYSDRYGTEFVISLVPFGGYVKLFKKPKEKFVDSEENCYSLNSKPVSKHIAIVAAGPIANFVFAFFSYLLVFVIGIPSNRPIIKRIIPNSIAESAEITPGMEIKEIDGIETNDWDTVRMRLITKIGDDYSMFSVSLPDSNQRQTKVVDLRKWDVNPNKEDPIAALGILPYDEWIEPTLSHVQLKSAACTAGLQVGDRIIKVNDRFVSNWAIFTNLVRKNPGKPLVLSIERKGVPLSLTLIPDSKVLENNQVEGFAGVSPKIILHSNKNKVIRKYNIVSAVKNAIHKTWQLIQLTSQMLRKLIVGDIKLDNLRGPISIAQEAKESAKFGIIYYLMFLAIISVNVGIINLLPLPILDGGHLLFLVIKKAIRRSVSKKIQDISYRISFLILMFLMWIVLFNDFSRVLER